MLEELFYIHKKTVENIPTRFKRYLYSAVNWDALHICIVGARGVGKTTMLLQYYFQEYADVEQCLYISADNVEIASVGLFNAAKEYFKYGGQAIIIDEAHKYPGWQVELKNIMDTFKDRKILVSGSSSLDLLRGKADLSRRIVYYHLKGLSFREYLELKENIRLPVYSLREITSKHVKIAQEVAYKKPILKYFKNYLLSGYYPFFVEGEGTYLSKVLNIIEKVLYEDVAASGGVKKSNVIALKKILWLVASSVSFCVNIEKMSRELALSKEYVYLYLEYLESAGLISPIRAGGRGYRLVRKPGKLYLENTNLLCAVNSHLRLESEQGVMRETFFVNQMKDNAKIALSPAGDFAVDDKYVFEIGGKDKKIHQIKGIKNAYIAADRIEVGQGNKVPLYLFGLLY